MFTRLLRVLIGIFLIFTLPVTIIPSLLVWIITGELYLYYAFEWCLLGDDY
jgi:hypothetical protein